MALSAFVGILDLIFGAALAASPFVDMAGSAWAYFFGAVMLIKGLIFLGQAFGDGIYFSLRGIIDVVAGIAFLLVASGFMHSGFLYLGILLMIKGFYYFFIDIAGSEN